MLLFVQKKIKRGIFEWEEILAFKEIICTERPFYLLLETIVSLLPRNGHRDLQWFSEVIYYTCHNLKVIWTNSLKERKTFHSKMI